MAEKWNRNKPVKWTGSEDLLKFGRKAVRSRQESVSGWMPRANSDPSKAWTWASLWAWNQGLQSSKRKLGKKVSLENWVWEVVGWSRLSLLAKTWAHILPDLEFGCVILPALWQNKSSKLLIWFWTRVAGGWVKAAKCFKTGRYEWRKREYIWTTIQNEYANQNPKIDK